MQLLLSGFFNSDLSFPIYRCCAFSVSSTPALQLQKKRWTWQVIHVCGLLFASPMLDRQFLHGISGALYAKHLVHILSPTSLSTISLSAKFRCRIIGQNFIPLAIRRVSLGLQVIRWGNMTCFSVVAFISMSLRQKWHPVFFPISDKIAWRWGSGMWGRVLSGTRVSIPSNLLKFIGSPAKRSSKLVTNHLLNLSVSATSVIVLFPWR